MIGGLFVLTWAKSVNNVRAAVEVGDAVKSVKQGDFQGGLVHLDRAIELAPDVSVYYDYKSAVYLGYQIRDDLPPEQRCGDQQNQTYQECLALQRYFLSTEVVRRRPFYYRSHMASANAAYTLGTGGATITTDGTDSGGGTTIILTDEAIRLY